MTGTAVGVARFGNHFAAASWPASGSLWIKIDPDGEAFELAAAWLEERNWPQPGQADRKVRLGVVALAPAMAQRSTAALAETVGLQFDDSGCGTSARGGACCGAIRARKPQPTWAGQPNWRLEPEMSSAERSEAQIRKRAVNAL